MYMYREYAAVRKLVMPRRTQEYLVKARILIRRRISLNRLMVGGVAILAAVNRNHHRAM